VVSVLTLAGCGGSGAAAHAASPASEPEPAAGAPTVSGKSTPVGDDAPPASPPAGGLPAACASPGDLCTPPGEFVERLCAHPHQEVALALFAKSRPFTRLYLRGRLDELTLDEEVLALRRHTVQKGGMVVGSGAGTYDVLRWDGTCSMAVDAEMVARQRPPEPGTARVLWHRIGDRMQTALVAGSDAVKKAHARRGKECRGATSGDVSAACEKADSALGRAIVEYVRGGGALPEPDAP
jgi:hypothetical protein